MKENNRAEKAHRQKGVRVIASRYKEETTAMLETVGSPGQRELICAPALPGQHFPEAERGQSGRGGTLASAHAQPLNVPLVRRSEWESYLRSSMQNPPDPGWMKMEPFS